MIYPIQALTLTLPEYPPRFLHFLRFEAFMQVLRVAISTTLLLVGSVSIALGQSGEAELSIAVVPKGTDRERWKAIHEGALKASEELAREGVRVKILWKGDSVAKRDKQIQVVDTFTGQRLSGILVASFDEDQFAGGIRIDRGSELPMVYIDSGLDADRPISYVATDNFEGGAVAADRIGQLINGVGNVILLRHRQGDSNAEAREAGFIERIKSGYPSIRMLSIDQYSGDSSSNAHRVSEYLLNRYGRRVNAIFASSSQGTDGMLQALRDFNLTGQVFLVGNDASAASIEAVRNGEVQGLLVTNPFKMGYLAVTTLVNHIQGGNIPTIVDTGVMLVTMANIESDEVKEALEPASGSL